MSSCKGHGGNPGYAPVAIALILSVLGACRGVPERDAAAGSWLAQRQKFFATHADWSSRGRLAISDGRRGVSVNFDLAHRGEGYELIMRTSGGRWTLTVMPGAAMLEGTRIEPMLAARPEPLVEHVLEWPVPVSLLVDWLRALPGERSPKGSVQMQLAGDGSLARIRYNDWEVEYTRYAVVRQGEAEVLMPVRLEATSGRYRIKTLIRDWEFGNT